MTSVLPRSAKALLLLAGLVPILSSAAAPRSRWFVDGDSFQTRREEKVAVLSPDRLSALRKLIAARDARQAEVVVLGRLAEEKAAAVAEMDRRFAGEYGIRADRNYTYDPADLTVYLLSTDARHGGTAEAPARLAHRVFPTEAEAQDFLALMQAKQEALVARQVFLSERTAKESALAEVLDRMGRDYKLDPARAYRLDAPTRSVFAEYIAPREPTPEERAAAAAAEKKAQQEALEKAKKLRDEAKRLAAEKEKKKAAERRAREEAEAKAKAEREKARAEAEAEKAAERKAREEVEAKAILEEKEALAAFIETTVAERKAQRDRAAMDKSAVESYAEFLAEREALLSRLKGAGRMTEPERKRLAAELSEVKASYAQAKEALNMAKKELSAAEDSLSRAEKDARKEFYQNLRAQGKKPLTEPSGIFSWF